MQEVVIEESRTCREGEVEEPQRVEKARSNNATVCGDCQAPLGGAQARTQLHTLPGFSWPARAPGGSSATHSITPGLPPHRTNVRLRPQTSMLNTDRAVCVLAAHVMIQFCATCCEALERDMDSERA
jgi:hypothetical protein